MPPSKRQVKIAELLRVSSRDESRFENPLFRREHSPVARLKNIEKLVKIPGGIGGQTQRAVKKIGRELEAIAKERLASGEFAQADYDDFIDRLETVKVRLRQMPQLRAQQKQERQRVLKALNPSEEERRKLLAEAHPPFAEPSGCEWYRDVIKGRVIWTLAVPFTPFEVIHKKELNNVGKISIDAAA